MTGVIEIPSSSDRWSGNVANVTDCDVDGKVPEGAGDWLLTVVVSTAVVVFVINQSRSTMMSDESDAGEDEREGVLSLSSLSLLLFEERHLFALKIGGGSGGMSSSGTVEITASTNGVLS